MAHRPAGGNAISAAHGRRPQAMARLIADHGLGCRQAS